MHTARGRGKIHYPPLSGAGSDRSTAHSAGQSGVLQVLTEKFSQVLWSLDYKNFLGESWIKTLTSKWSQEFS